jgi:transposase
MEIIVMSGKEAPRPGLLRSLKAGLITNRQAATALGLTIRHIQRLKDRFARTGVAGLVHRGRGQPSPQRLADDLRAQILALMTDVYEDVNDVQMTEKLRELHHLTVSRSTVRRLRRGLGRAAVRPRRAPQHRQRRAREMAAGSLVQLDGSTHAWLEHRGPTGTLLGAIDDATGAIVGLHFRPAEDLHGYLTLLAQIVHAHGLPVALYGDRLNVFVRTDRHWSLDEELQGHQHPTHFGRALHALGVGYIAAQSPQAKGRIERLWQTLQDRLVTELRLAGIATREAANAFLPTFIADFNRRFAQPAPGAPVWRPAPADGALLLGCRYTAVVGRDNTVRLGPRWVQLPPGPHGRSHAGRRVEVRELLDGRLLALADGRVLASQPAPALDFVLRPRRLARLLTDREARAPSPTPPRPAAPVTPAPVRGPRPRPTADHPWNQSLRRHVERKALRQSLRPRSRTRG